MSSTDIPTYRGESHDIDNLYFAVLPLNLRKEGYDYGKPHRHDYYEMFYFEGGGGEHEIDFARYPIRNFSLHAVPPGRIHQVRRNPGSYGSVIVFNQDFYALGAGAGDPFRDMPFMRPDVAPTIQLPAAEREHFGQVLGLLQREYAASGLERVDIVRTYLSLILQYARRVFVDEHGSEAPEDGVGRSASEQIKRFTALVEEHFRSVHSVSRYASMLFITPSHLNDLCQKALGKSAGELIQERIILEAKRLLFYSEDSVKEIAFTLNFADPSYFGRFFRKNTGASPGDFRRTIRKKYQ